ncbi:MAG: hypothetical protein MUC50_12270 [Myxococcota bacterium]|jgi:hypothetical protein|nr:hypothetical protein [Myxococcota bacterium]
MRNNKRTKKTVKVVVLCLSLSTLAAKCNRNDTSIECCECMIEADKYQCSLDQDSDECLGECEGSHFRCPTVEEAGCADLCECED